ncbi:hypothetical protein ACQ4PT_046725 [Festuca glaucescens]
MAALLRTAVRRAAPAIRFSDHPAATGAAMARGTFQRRTMHSGGGWHNFYASPVFFGSGHWNRADNYFAVFAVTVMLAYRHYVMEQADKRNITDNYFAVFAVTVMLAYRHYVMEQADKRWSREQSRREERERLWARFQTGGPSNDGVVVASLASRTSLRPDQGSTVVTTGASLPLTAKEGDESNVHTEEGTRACSSGTVVGSYTACTLALPPPDDLEEVLGLTAALITSFNKVQLAFPETAYRWSAEGMGIINIEHDNDGITDGKMGIIGFTDPDDDGDNDDNPLDEDWCTFERNQHN